MRAPLRGQNGRGKRPPKQSRHSKRKTKQSRPRKRSALCIGGNGDMRRKGGSAAGESSGERCGVWCGVWRRRGAVQGNAKGKRAGILSTASVVISDGIVVICYRYCRRQSWSSSVMVVVRRYRRRRHRVLRRSARSGQALRRLPPRPRGGAGVRRAYNTYRLWQSVPHACRVR